MSDPLEAGHDVESGHGGDGGERSASSVAAVIDAYHDPESSEREIPTGEDADGAFERRLGSLVGWGIDHDVAFDRAWTIRTAHREYDVMAEFVYLAKQRSADED